MNFSPIIYLKNNLSSLDIIYGFIFEYSVQFLIDNSSDLNHFNKIIIILKITFVFCVFLETKFILRIFCEIFRILQKHMNFLVSLYINDYDNLCVIFFPNFLTITITVVMFLLYSKVTIIQALILSL